MALPSEQTAWVEWLARRHDQDKPHLKALNDLYEGTAPLMYLHPEILAEVGDRLQAVSLGWPQLAIDPLEERLDMVGFRDARGNADDDLRRVYQSNNMDEEGQLAHVDALVMRRGYIAVGTNEDDADTPLVTVESPLELYADVDPRTRKVRAALRRYSDDVNPVVATPEQYATLYLPDVTVWYDRGPQGWREVGRDEHRLGEVPIAPLVNRARSGQRYGQSELTPAMLSLSHAANKLATDLMVAAEFHAMPLRAVFGVGAEDFVDEKGKRRSALQVIMGRLLAVGIEDGNKIKPFEFSSSSLTNFIDSMNQLAKHATALAGLPPTAFGVVTDTPASAEAWRAAESRLVKRAERRQLAFGGGHERAGRLIRRFQTGDWDPAMTAIEAEWRDAATPTRAQAADAAVKLFGEGITTKKQARLDLGYTEVQIEQMEADDRAAADQDPVAGIARQLAAVPAAPPVSVPAPADVG